MVSRNWVVGSLVAVVVSVSGLAAQATPPSFGDVQNWYGAPTGANTYSAGLIIDWNDGKGPDYQLYGYRWLTTDPTPTVQTMLDTIVATPGSGLYVNYQNFNGTVVFGLGQDTNGDGFTPVPSTLDEFGYLNEDGYSADPADHYAEGWYVSGFWGHYVATSSASDWQYALDGIAQPLTNGMWDGWSFGAASAGWDGGLPAVPEPASLSLLGLARRGPVTAAQVNCQSHLTSRQVRPVSGRACGRIAPAMVFVI